jgi:hypothetical protein
VEVKEQYQPKMALENLDEIVDISIICESITKLQPKTV